MVNIGGGGGSALSMPSGHAATTSALAGNDEAAAVAAAFGGDTTANANMQDNGVDGKQDEQSGRGQRTPYTMPGVLHFIQHEWSKFEMDRAQWEMERAEMQARISFLQGERKGQENLKQDLIRRIKMLEFSLKQERAKNYRLTHNGLDPDADATSADDNQDGDARVPLDIDALSMQPSSHTSWRQGRQLLRQYLQEIGYSETILDVRSFRVKNLLGLLPQAEWPGSADHDGNDPRSAASRALAESERAILETAAFLQKTATKRGGGQQTGNAVVDDASDSDEEADRGGQVAKGHVASAGKDLDLETVAALEEFSFLGDEKATTRATPVGSGSRKKEGKNDQQRDDEWAVNPKTLEQMKEKYRSEQERKRGDHGASAKQVPYFRSDNDPAKAIDTAYDSAGFFEVACGKPGGKSDFLDINTALGLPGDDGAVDIKDDFVPDDDAIGGGVRWQLRQTLRSHWDCIRAMQFHPVEPVLVTAGEDGTAKLWNLSAAANTKSGEGKAGNSTTSTDLEPVYTFRGHRGQILAMDMSPTGDQCYTGGIDGSICCWTIPSISMDIYDRYDAKILIEKLRGHADAIWSIAFHTSDNRLVSASADGTIKLWEPGVSEPLLKTYAAPSSQLVPTSIDFVSTEPQQLLAAYSSSHACVLDLETGRSVLQFEMKDDENVGVGRITKILSHPTMPVTVTAGDDRKIRYFDNNTGKLIQGTVAHVEGISSLAIDPNGLYLLSGSHDGSLRLWNMEKRVCLQEIAAHRKKFDMAVLTVAFHPSRPLIGSGGADGLAKVFASQRSQYTGIAGAIGD